MSNVSWKYNDGAWRKDICYAAMFGTRWNPVKRDNVEIIYTKFKTVLPFEDLRSYIADAKKYLIPEFLHKHYKVRITNKKQGRYIISVNPRVLTAMDVIFLFTHFRVPHEEDAVARRYIENRKAGMTFDQAYMHAHIHDTDNANHTLFSFNSLQMNDMSDEAMYFLRDQYSFRQHWIDYRGEIPYSQKPQKGIIWQCFGYGKMLKVVKGVGIDDPAIDYQDYHARRCLLQKKLQDQIGNTWSNIMDELRKLFLGEIAIEDRRYWR